MSDERFAAANIRRARDHARSVNWWGRMATKAIELELPVQYIRAGAARAAHYYHERETCLGRPRPQEEPSNV